VTDATRTAETPEALEAIGDRLREAREQRGLSQRKLAQRLGLSPSLISQLESGQTRPSVGTLYSIVTELDISLDSVIRGGDDVRATDVVADTDGASPVVRRHERQTLDLDSGVRWEELSTISEEGVDFLRATYQVGGASTPDESLMRHHGREYGYIISGTLGIQIGFKEYTLEAGDSIAFDSERPHRLFNKGDVPVDAIWFVNGRSSDHRAAET
jgi:transcriptional regulator with XRE-family HTH domain